MLIIHKKKYNNNINLVLEKSKKYIRKFQTQKRNIIILLRMLKYFSKLNQTINLSFFETLERLVL